MQTADVFRPQTDVAVQQFLDSGAWPSRSRTNSTVSRVPLKTGLPSITSWLAFDIVLPVHV